MNRWAQAFILMECKWTEPSNACQTASVQNVITEVELVLWMRAEVNMSLNRNGDACNTI